MARIIAVGNRKGGVGKTTTIIELAKEFSDRDYTVLVVDFDPQGNATHKLLGLELDEDLEEGMSQAMDLFMQPKIGIVDCIYKATDDWPNVHILPSSDTLANLDVLLNGRMGYEKILRNKLTEIESSYDVILIDTGPEINVKTFLAFFASDLVLIPTDLSEDAHNGIYAAYAVLDSLAEHSGRDNISRTILITQSQKEHSKAHKIAKQRLIKDFGSAVIDSFTIPHRAKVRESSWAFTPAISAKTVFNKSKKSQEQFVLSYKKLAETVYGESRSEDN